MSSHPEYLLDNAAPETGARFHGLEAVLDPVTLRHLDDLGVGDGWSCLEVGAGGGSVARWLAARAGASGRVLATDVNPDWCDGGGAPNLEVRRHDIVGDPLPEQAFDVVHARLVLGHLGARNEVLKTLVRSLRPGGLLLVEDFDDMVPACPHAPTERELLVNRIREAFCALLRTGGGDNGYPRTLPWRLRQAGLVGRAPVVTWRSPLVDPKARRWNGRTSNRWGTGWCRRVGHGRRVAALSGGDGRFLVPVRPAVVHLRVGPGAGRNLRLSGPSSHARPDPRSKHRPVAGHRPLGPRDHRPDRR